MVKKASPSKTKKSETVEEQIERLAEEAPKKESQPQMMQVVEVVEEEIEIPKNEEQKSAPVTEETANTEATESETTPQEETKTEEEKKQEVVSEFFAKKSIPQADKESAPTSFGYPDISVHKKSPVSGVVMWALGIILLVVIIGAVIIAVSRGSVTMSVFGVKPTPTPTMQPTPTAVPTPVIDKTTLKIQVLNGSGTAGEAGKMKTLLEEKGYTVVGTGNAKTYDYEKTEIQSTSVNETVLGVLQTDISGTYTVGSTAATLKDTLPYNVLVIVGKE